MSGGFYDLFQSSGKVGLETEMSRNERNFKKTILLKFNLF